MGTFVCFLRAFVALALLIKLSDAQGKGAPINRARARVRPLIPRPQGTTMSPEKMRIALRNGAVVQQRQKGPSNVINPPNNVINPPSNVINPPNNVINPPSNVINPPSNMNNPPNNANNPPNNVNNPPSSSNNQNQGTINTGGRGGQGQSSWSQGRRRNNRGNSMNVNNMMFCPDQMPSDCPEIQPKPGCFSQNIQTFMGRPCRGCPFDMCERSGLNPMDMAKKMARMGMNPMQYMNQNMAQNMNAFRQAMYYDSSFFENMPPWMAYSWNFNQNNGGGGGWNNGGGSGNGSNGSGGGNGSGVGNNGGSNSGNGGNNQGGWGTQNNGQFSPFEQYMWHKMITK